jgi:flagellar biosynthesis protein FlhB
VSHDKTEQPTPRRIAEARRRGDVAQGRDLTGAASLLCGLVALAAAAPGVTRGLGEAMAVALARAPLDVGAPAPAAALLADAARTVLRLALLPALAAAAGGLAAGLLATRFNFAPGALRPRLERVDPLRGLRRLVAPGHLAAVALGVTKGAVLLAVAALWYRDAAGGLAGLARAEGVALLRAAPALLGLALRLAAVFVLFGVVDHALAARRQRRALRMSRDEVRREQKEEEGDPLHRAERRRVHQALLHAGPVRRATVVVVNPTHVAVALHHERAGGEAPRVVAKGTGLRAARIRSLARRAGVPIVRDVPLARALHRLAEVGDEIPEELYEAAAAVLAHLYGREETP